MKVNGSRYSWNICGANPSLNDLRKRGGDHLSYLKAAISLNYDTTSDLIELTDPIAKERPVYWLGLKEFTQAWDKGQEEPRWQIEQPIALTVMDEREEGRSEDGVYSNELNKQANKIKLLLLNQLLITKSFV